MIIKKSIILFSLLALISPPLFGQNDFLLFKLNPFPEKELIDDTLLFRLTPFPEKELIDDIDYDKILFRESLLSNIQSIQAVTLVQPDEKRARVFFNSIDKKIYEDTAKRRDEKKIIREQWKDFFGIDIWYPYFKAKEIESWISDKAKIEIFRLKGRLKFEGSQVKYTFKRQF